MCATQADVRVRRTIKWSKIGIVSAKAYPVFVLWFALTAIHRSRSGETWGGGGRGSHE